MSRKIPLIADSTYYVGSNDRKKQLFENLWPLENGVAYNSYVIKDEKTVLIDTVDMNVLEDFLAKLEKILCGKPIDYLVINHMEPDHCSGIPFICKLYPDVTLVGNKKTFEFLESLLGITAKTLVVEEGSTLDIGSRKLQFMLTPMVHWPEVMMTYDQKTKTLFSADAFGSFGTLDGGITDLELNMDYYWEEFLRYYSNIVGRFGVPVQNALKKCANFDIQMIASTHGPIWKDPENIKKIIGLYNKWSKYETDKGVVICYGSMYGNTEAMAELIGRELAEKGIKNIRIFDVSKTHPSYILREIFKYKGLIVGSATYNGGMHPNVETLIMKIKNTMIKNHYFGTFGSFSWSGEAPKHLSEFAEEMKWEIVSPAVRLKGMLSVDKYEECKVLADMMADKLNQ